MPRRLKPEEITHKQMCQEFYNSWKGEKISFLSFYQKYNMWKWLVSMEEAIVAKKYEPHKKKPTWKWAEEFIWYDQQMEPKANRGLFRGRLNSWYCKEEAIMVWEDREKAKAKRKEATIQKPSKQYVSRSANSLVRDSEDRHYIDITYPKDVARVFRNEYERMIGDTEDELMFTQEKEKVVELNSRLDDLTDELDTFNRYNK